MTPRTGGPVRENALLDDPRNTLITAALLFAFSAAYVLCWLGMGPQTLAWTLNRATGTAAYLLLALTTATGALLGSRSAPRWLTRAQQGGWHGVASGFALALGGLHGLLLTVDAQYPQRLTAVLIPGASTVHPSRSRWARWGGTACSSSWSAPDCGPGCPPRSGRGCT
ncbi:hypothetical protein [Deinococcus apachensis]|uniref:hypothetical protein n=1 Tax=Deinococcus apachensis TaxID=309886 RepID=UPI00039A7D43|nr:hypothetical protein [Deinococcus apachensis]